MARPIERGTSTFVEAVTATILRGELSLRRDIGVPLGTAGVIPIFSTHREMSPNPDRPAVLRAPPRALETAREASKLCRSC